jgi:hypothetical protein
MNKPHPNEISSDPVSGNLASANLDRILLERDSLLPSSGFAASVLETIQQQTAAPAPIPFPWKRALPGLAVLTLALAIVTGMIQTTVQSIIQSPPAAGDWLAWFRSNAQSAILLRTQAAPVLLAVAASCLCILLCRKLIGGSALR